MFICSVSTLVFNANPLLRYDGYYILADLTEIPNLRQKATTILSRKLGEWCLGLESQEDPFLPQRNQLFFALYSVAAAAYRWVVAISICWFLYKLFQSYHLKVVGQIVVLMSLYGLFFMPLYQLGKFFYVPGRIDQVKKPYFYTTLGVLTALALAFCFLPLPHSVVCTLEVQARDAKPVYIDVAGNLFERYVKPGERVVVGQALAQLQNFDLELEVAKLEGTVKEYSQKLKDLRQQRFRDSHALGEIPAVEEALAAAEKQLKEKREDQGRLLFSGAQAGGPGPQEPDGPAPAGDTQPRRSRGETAHVVGHALGPRELGRPPRAERSVLPDRRSESVGGRAGHRSDRPKPHPGRPGR